MIGLVLVGYATNEVSYMLFGYLTDSYGPYAALSLSRTLMAAVFLPFTHAMYNCLGGRDFATSILAAIATVFCVTPVVFIRYRRKLRGVSRFAQADESGNDTDEEKGSGEEKESNERGQSDSLTSLTLGLARENGFWRRWFPFQQYLPPAQVSNFSKLGHPDSFARILFNDDSWDAIRTWFTTCA